MDSDYKTDDSVWNLMHQTNDKIRIGENAKVTQHDQYFENSDEGNDEEHLEAPHCTILDLSVANKNACICWKKMYLKVIQGLGFALHSPHLT